MLSGFLTVTSGCNSQTTPEVEEMQSLRLNPPYLELPNNGEGESVTVFSSQPWELMAKDDWIKASRNTGENLETVIISATVNESLSDREGRATFKSGNREIHLYVTQKAPVFSTIERNVRDFMALHNIPSASIAITYKEKLVYSNAFGMADVEQQVPATTSSVYRIASISKVITLATILKMVDEGKLTVDQKVFGPNGILGFDFTETYADPRVYDITVHQLLRHEGGWTEVFGDWGADIPIYVNQVLTRSPLGYTPGTSYYYSNFGYLILGKIIEKISGERYEDYVKSKILAPMGITDMHIGRNRPAERKDNEVFYYQDGKRVEYTPVWQYEAGGGWVASAESLMKFLVRVDRNHHHYPDIIPVELMAPYLLGWGVWYHDGGLVGTCTRAGRLNDDINFAILFNTSVPFDRLTIGEVILNQSEWPTGILFEDL